MGRRSAQHRFMPNVLVFPGGAVDQADYTAAVASPMPGAVTARLQRGASPELAQALGVTAARELCEEVGVHLGQPPHLAGFDYLCRAITPPNRSIRFDARFFIVDAAYVVGEPVPSPEIEEPRWVSIEEAQNSTIVPATAAVLEVLTRWLQTPGGFTRTQVLRDRRWEDE